MGKAPCAQTRVFLGRPGVARGSGECARITCAGRVHWGSARRVVAVVARSRSVDRYLVVSSDLPAAGAPPRLRPGARFGGRRGQPQRVRGWSAALRVVRSAHRVPGQAGDVPRAGRVGAGAHRADRGAPCAADRRPLLSALSVLRGGGLVAVFPEGTRTGGDVAAAQHGAAWLARAGGAVVLPMVCRGTHRPDGARRRLRPRVDVLVGEPLPLPALQVGGGRAVLAAATETVRAVLAEMVAELDELRRTT